jgi:hypothetical protein
MGVKCKVCGKEANPIYAGPYCSTACYDKDAKKEDEVIILKDSGARTEFDSGAVRDLQVGKGRCDLLPLDVVGEFIAAPELTYIEEFKETKDIKTLYSAIRAFAERLKVDVYTLILEVSKHFESGAIKYGENNWKKGMGLHYYISSAGRHFLKHERGDTDEPHDRAFVWNLLCAIWTYKHKPELDDINIDMAPKQKLYSPNEIRAAYGLPPIATHDFLNKEFNIPEETTIDNKDGTFSKIIRE